MTNVVLCTASQELVERFRTATAGTLTPLPHPLPGSPAHLLSQLGPGLTPDVVVIDAGTDPDEAVQFATVMHEQVPHIAVVLVTDQPDQIGVSRIVRSGVRDVLPTAAQIPEIHRALEAAAQTAQNLSPAAQPTPDAPAGKVITITSPKGGVGKTMIATNIAVGLARLQPGSTVLVDLDLQFGDVANSLNLPVTHTITDALAGPGAEDPLALRTYLAVHEPTGLRVLCAPPNPAEADAITSGQVAGLLAALTRQFPYVVVDTTPGLPPHTLEVLDQTTDTVLVTAQTVASVRGLRQAIDTLDLAGMAQSNRTVVVNMADSRRGLTINDVTRILQAQVASVLPHTDSALVSAEMGEPLLASPNKRDPLVKELVNLVNHFHGTTASQPDTSHRRSRRKLGRRAA